MSTVKTSTVKPIVFVHGFWLDASSYGQIIAPLLVEGYEVISVQNPLTSLAEDVAATKRALDRVEGDCILVGHSWGGTVITEVGNDDRVAGLVYLAALAPDAGESMIDLMSKYATPSPHFQAQDGFVWTSEEGVRTILANDLSAEQVGLIYAAQLPPSVSLLAANVTSAAWKTKPSWYVIATDDRSVPPELQRDLAQRMGATAIEVASSHVGVLFQATIVLDVIRAAANAGGSD